MASLMFVRSVVCQNCFCNNFHNLRDLFNRSQHLVQISGRRKLSASRNSFRLIKTKFTGSEICNTDNKQHHHQQIQRLFFSTLPPSTDPKRYYVPDVSVIEGVITAKDEKGLCLLTLPLYSRDEVCRFVLKPLLNTLNDLYNSIRVEDPGIEKMRAFTTEGELISQNTSCSNLLKRDFIIQMNGLFYLIKLNGLDFSAPHVEGDAVKNMVAQLYMAISCEELYVKRQELLLKKLEELQVELLPMEKTLTELHDLAAKKTRMMAWTGLGMMGLQFGILARLTWWDYSWDIMEPVTYFVTYGTIMAMFSYYIVTNQEYLYPEVSDRQVVRLLHKIAKKGEFDITRYNKLTDEAGRIKFELNRLRDPIKLKLHPPHIKPHTILPTL